MKWPRLETWLAAVLLYFGIQRVWTLIADPPWYPWTLKAWATPLRVSPAMAQWVTSVAGMPATVAFFVAAYAVLFRRRWASAAYLAFVGALLLDFASFVYVVGAVPLSEFSIGLTAIIAPFLLVGWLIARRLDSGNTNAL